MEAELQMIRDTKGFADGIVSDDYNVTTGKFVKMYYYKGFDGYVEVYDDGSAVLSGFGRKCEYFENKQRAFDKAKLLNQRGKALDRMLG